MLLKYICKLSKDKLGSLYSLLIPTVCHTLLLSDTPDPPCSISIGEMNEDGSIEIKWAPPVNTGGSPIKHYCLQVYNY